MPRFVPDINRIHNPQPVHKVGNFITEDNFTPDCGCGSDVYYLNIGRTTIGYVITARNIRTLAAISSAHGGVRIKLRGRETKIS